MERSVEYATQGAAFLAAAIKRRFNSPLPPTKRRRRRLHLCCARDPHAKKHRPGMTGMYETAILFMQAVGARLEYHHAKERPASSEGAAEGVEVRRRRRGVALWCCGGRGGAEAFPALPRPAVPSRK